MHRPYGVPSDAIGGSKAGFEEVEHTADAAIRVWGRDLGELFVMAARGMAQQMADVDAVPRTTSREIALAAGGNAEAGDVETLLVAWLSELLYLDERDGCVFVDFEVREIAPNRLRAVAYGGPVREYRRYVKAVTYSELAVRRTSGGYETIVVFDV